LRAKVVHARMSVALPPQFLVSFDVSTHLQDRTRHTIKSEAAANARMNGWPVRGYPAITSKEKLREARKAA